MRISISKIEYSNIWTKSGSKDEADTPRFSILIFSKTTFDSFSKCLEKKEDVWKRERDYNAMALSFKPKCLRCS